MLEIPNLNIVYEDDSIIIYIHEVGGVLVLHAFVEPSNQLSLMKHYQYVVENLFQKLRERGLKEIQTWVLTDTQIRYAMFFGFDLTGEEITFDGETYETPIYKMVKDLT